MTVSTQNRFNFRHIAIASLAALAVSASGLSAHAASSSSEPVSVTVTLPNKWRQGCHPAAEAQTPFERRRNNSLSYHNLRFHRVSVNSQKPVLCVACLRYILSLL